MEEHKAKIFAILEGFAPVIPAPVSWTDKDCVLMGYNSLVSKAVGEAFKGMIIGKTPYEFEFYSKKDADIMVQKMRQAMQEKRPVTFEESIEDMSNGKTRWYLTTRAPLFDDDGVNVVGTIGTSVEITDRKENEQLRLETEQQKIALKEQLKFRKVIDQAAYDTLSPLAILLVLTQNCMGLTKEKIFDTLKTVTAFLPINICWVDVNNVVMGGSKYTAEAIGGVSIDEFIGKTAYDLYPYEMADNIILHNKEVIRTGKVLSQEEPIRDVKTGKTKYFTAFKAPLHDDKGNIVGLISASVDITAEKDAERLKLETELQKAKLVEQEQFRRVANQVVHDIRSPLASLLMIVKSCEENISEQARIALREAAISIGDIADNMLGKYKEKKFDVSAIETRQPVMLALALSQLLGEKKHQYKELPVEFTHKFCPKCSFTFIKMEFTAFKRMISNLINNAVEALDGKEGVVNLKLDMDDQGVKIILQDNGKGIPQEIIDKIMNNIVVTAGKKDGNGIGFTQIWETLQRNQGRITINSKVGKGTEIILTFPIIAPPEWVAKEIKLNKGDTVVILDDDSSIHHAWDSRFKTHDRDVSLKHFTLGKEAVDFINNFQEKEKIFLLADFELLKQELNGMDAIERTNIKRAILVTSHYTNLGTRNLAIKNKIKILPKPLASEVPIEIENNKKNGKYTTKYGKNNNSEMQNVMRNDERTEKNADNLKKVDLVLIDDNKMFADVLTIFFEGKNKIVDKYYKPSHFLENISQYVKDTRIFMDNDFGEHMMKGIDLAKELYTKGYTKLYLLSGKDFEEGEVPDYLTVVPKTNTDMLLSFVDGP